MLERVVQALEASRPISKIWTSIDAPELLPHAGTLGGRIDRGDLQVLPSADSPSLSVLEALDAIPSTLPLLVTTADHALLDPPMVEYFLEAAEREAADISLALVPEGVIQRRFPDTKRTFIPLRGSRFSGANLFVFRTPAARRGIEFWSRVEQHRKQPWRLVRSFGPLSLLLFLLRRLDLKQASARVSQILGARVAIVEMPQAEAAIDVDRLSDYHQVRAILENRLQSQPR